MIRGTRFMAITCKLEFGYDSKEEAEAIAKAVEVDNYQFVKTTVHDKQIISTVKSESIPSLIHTLDDFLACVGVAEKVLKKE